MRDRSEIVSVLNEITKGTRYTWCFEPKYPHFELPAMDTWFICDTLLERPGGWFTERSYYQNTSGSFFGTAAGDPCKAARRIMDHLIERDARFDGTPPTTSKVVR